MLLIAGLYSDAKKFGEATRVIDEVEQIAQNIEDPTSKADTLASLAISYARAAQLERATQLAATATPVAAMIDNPYRKASALQAIATAYAHAGQMDKAIGVLSQALQTIKTVKAGKDYTTPLDSAENTLREKAKSLASDKQFALALHVCQSLENMSDIDILGDIGAKYTKSGQKLDGAARKILHDIIAANQ